MSLFSKLTGIDNKYSKKQSAAPILEDEKINFFDKNYIQENKKIKKQKNKKEQIMEGIDENNFDEIGAGKKYIEKPEWNGQDYEEGELSIDVYQDKNDIIVKSTIAGVKPEDIDISVNNDMLTIRGKREHEEIIDEKNYYYKECYWGNFSRSIILPCEVKTDKITAKLKNGVLIVSLPKEKTEKKVAIKVIEE
ncbi:MAG: Hsp20/alpha crystallin family protein [bacterium]